MKYHLIVGFGKWSKKNFNYLKSKNKISNIIIKKRDEYIYPYKKEISKKSLNKILKKIDTVHICTPLENHFKSLNKFKFKKKIIVEKPIVEKKSQLKIIRKIYKNKFFIVNYIDTFNPLINKISLLLKKKFSKIIINYSKKNKYYKKKNEFVNEWLAHPLSLILFFFKKFEKFKIISASINKKGKLYNQSIIIKYFYSNFEININLNTSKKIQRNLQVFDDKTYTTFHFYKNSIYRENKKIFQSKKNSFDIFYRMIKSGKKILRKILLFMSKFLVKNRRLLKF